ncbi:MAG: PrsW family glutamic-type intramembrane protease [Patescibacteria group bacterium]
MTSDPKIIALALTGGLIPALLWLWFWIKREQKKSEPKGVLAIIFIAGMIGVVFVLPIQKFIHAHISSPDGQLILWASAEEIIKYLVVLLILYRTTYIDEPMEWPIYMMTAALGFAGLENALFLVKPLDIGNNLMGLLTGELRFLGSTLLHAISSGILGITLGISLHMGWFKKKIYFIVGLILAIALHSIFNFFIIGENAGDLNNFFKVCGFLWVVTIIVMLLFEKVRRMD